MKRSALLDSATFVLSGALLVAACTTSETIGSDADPEASLLLLAHSPAHHGVSATPAVTSEPAYAGLDGAAAEARGGSVHLTANASGAIPRFPDAFISSVAVFGYAWADLDTGQGIVSVIHPAIGRDSRQNPDGWHTHPVRLTGGTKPSGTSDFCIASIGTSQAGITIQRDVMGVHMPLEWAGVSADALDVAASFYVQGDSGCAATGLGVVLLDTTAL